MKIISTKVHGVLDYIVGIALILAPYIFGFADVGGMAVLIPQVLGIGLIVYSLLTNYELGLIKAIPVKVHLGVDYIASLFLAASPWLFGFVNNDLNVWVPHVVVGVAVLIVTLMTQTAPRGSMSSM